MNQSKRPADLRRVAPPLLLPLDREAAEPLFRQIYGGIREAILSGQLPGGMRLPATRLLAKDLAVARTTVLLAYEQLLAEGYLRGQGSAGTYVAPLTLPRKAPGKSVAKNPVSRPGQAVTHATRSRPFRVGEPGLDLFPIGVWNRLQARRARTSAADLLSYGDGSGFLPLRQAIVDYTAASRGVRAAPEQVILVRGAQQAVDLVARVLLRPQDEVWFEDPGYAVARILFERAGATIVPVPLDANGLMVDAGIKRGPDARMVYVAPSHQFPLGRALSIERRLALLAWAAQSKAWIVEDDYDSEFRYPGHPISSLQGLDSRDRVIYVGTFSKTAFPALRLGYLIVPPELVDRMAQARRDIDHLAATLEQATLTDFIEDGHFTRHLRRMRTAYQERQAALVAAAATELAGLITVEPADAGMHAIAWLQRPGADDREVSRRALDIGIEAPPLSRYCMRASLPPALLLGFAAVRPHAMAPALKALRAVL